MRIPSVPGFDQGAFEKYFKNAGWLMSGKILSMVVGFMIAQFLGPSAFGDLSFATAFTAIIAAIATLGLDSFIIREILNDPEKQNEILGTAFWLRIVVGALIIPVSVLSYLFFHNLADQPGDSLTLIISLCASASFFKAFNIIDSYFQSQVKSKHVVQVQNSCLVLSSAIKIWFVWLELPLIYFALALVIDGFLLSIGLVVMYRSQNLHIRQWTFSADRAKSLLKQSWPLILTTVMITLYMQIDTIMLKDIRGSAQVGIYSAAARISEAWYFIPVAIISSVFPAIIYARKNDSERYMKRLQNLYDLLIGISLPVALLISFSSNIIIDFLYGTEFEGAGPILSIHIWSGIFVFLGSASSQYLLAEGFTLISFYRTAIGAAINIVLNLFLIPWYGGIGASIATLIAYFAATFSILLFPGGRQQGLMMIKSLFLISMIGNFFKLRSDN